MWRFSNDFNAIFCDGEPCWVPAGRVFSVGEVGVPFVDFGLFLRRFRAWAHAQVSMLRLKDEGIDWVIVGGQDAQRNAGRCCSLGRG
ncbi:MULTISPECIES: hypothetical protein [unclassified Novosphingobium]|uniref:hypothetical protein n=1 Tax=unclassified Novosphingobium TaxID=2644732 RepID=UPI001359004C|nr:MULTISPECIES: hypothetical protein [unclassified Novosphingobium]